MSFDEDTSADEGGQKGNRMPPFTLPDSDGALVTSADLLRAGPLVVFFYPKDETIGCTIEACGFRDAFGELQEAGATVVGISSDEIASHRHFKNRHALPYRLLSDAGGAIAKTFGVRKVLGLWSARETFVVDRDGVIREHLRSLIDPRRHVAVALAAVLKLPPSPPNASPPI